MNVLEFAYLFSVEPQCNRRLYSIKCVGMNDLRQYLDRFRSDALSAYGAETARHMKNCSENILLDPIIRTIEVSCNQKKAFGEERTRIELAQSNWEAFPNDRESNIDD